MDVLELLNCREHFRDHFDQDDPTPLGKLEDVAAENRFLIHVIAEQLVQFEGQVKIFSEKYRTVGQFVQPVGGMPCQRSLGPHSEFGRCFGVAS